MPNGRSGGFYLKPADFERLLRQHPEETIVGKTLKEPVTIADVMGVLRKWKGDAVPIEEQECSWYIVHFPEWVIVGDMSPLFQSFRHAHAEFVKKKEPYDDAPDLSVRPVDSIHRRLAALVARVFRLKHWR